MALLQCSCSEVSRYLALPHIISVKKMINQESIEDTKPNPFHQDVYYKKSEKKKQSSWKL